MGSCTRGRLILQRINIQKNSSAPGVDKEQACTT